MSKRRLLWVAILSQMAATLVFVALDSTGALVQDWPVAPVLAARAVVAPFAAVLAIALTLIVLLTRCTRRLRTLGVVNALVTLLLCTFVLVEAGGPESATALPSREPGTIRILSWNVRQLESGPAQLQTTINEVDPDVIVLPELYSENLIVRHVNIVDSDTFQLLGTKDAEVSIYVRRSLGQYHVAAADSTSAASGAVLDPASGSRAPRIIAVHLTSPASPSRSVGWRQGLRWITGYCNGRNVVTIGDFNTAPVNIPGDALGSCELKLNQSGPTWPTNLPYHFGLPIDHIMVASGWRLDYFRVLGIEASWTDHRPVFGIIQPA